MVRWWTGRTLGVVLLGAASGGVACGGSSKRQLPATGGTSGDAGQGGTGGTSGKAGQGGASGTTGGAGGGTAGTPSTQRGGAGGQSGGSAAASSGRSGASGAGSGGSVSGGSAGETGGSGGADAGDAGSGGAPVCHDLCTEDAPACCAPGLDCVDTVASCRIDVLSEDVGVIYEYEDLEAAIALLPADVLLSIPDTAIAWAAADGPSAARFELRLDESTSDAVKSTLASTNVNPFRVTCGGSELFVGVLYLRGGAAAIRTPVLHLDTSTNPTATLLLGAYQGAWYGSNGDDALRARIDRPELRATLCARGILNEL